MAGQTGEICTFRVSTSAYMPERNWVLKRRGEIVIIVPQGAPIEDAVFDELMVPQSDYEKITRRVTLHPPAR